MKHLKSTLRTLPTTAANRRGGAAALLLILLLVAGAGFAVYWFAIRGGGANGVTAQLVKTHVPASANAVGGIDMNGLLSSDLLKEVTGKDFADEPAFKTWVEKTKVDPRTIKNVAFGLDLNSQGAPQDLLFVVDGDFDTKALGAALLLAQTEGGTNLGGLAEPAVVRTTATGEVLAGTTKWVNPATPHDGTRDKDLAKLAAAVNTGAEFWMSAKLPADLAGGGANAMALSMAGLKGMPSHGAFSVDLDGSQVSFEAALLLPGSDASAVASKIDGLLGMAAMAQSGPQADLMKALNFAGDGELLSINITVSASQLKAMAKNIPMPF